jgi:hypothetical protein
MSRTEYLVLEPHSARFPTRDNLYKTKMLGWSLMVVGTSAGLPTLELW